MSLIRCAVLLPVAALAVSASAQTLSSPGNVPVVGSSFPMDSAAYATPVAGGQFLTFDHSGLVSNGTVTYDWIAPAEYSDPSLFPTAEMALANGTDTSFYRYVAGSGLEKVGDRRTYVGSYVVEAPLTDGALELRLPLSYGESWTDGISGTFTVDGNQASRLGSITGEADATGTLLLPGGSSTDVLRVRTRVTETTSIALFLPLTVTHHRTEWTYHSPFLDAPLLRVYADTLSSSIGITQYTKGTEWLDASLLGVKDRASDAFGLTLVPNPAGTTVDLNYLTFGTQRMTLVITDMRGAEVLRKDLGARGASLQRERIDVSTLDAGLYTVSLLDAAGARSLKQLSVVH